MATIYFSRNNSDANTFYKTNVENPQQLIDSLNSDEDNFVNGERIHYFGFITQNMSEHKFYGFDSKEEMMDFLYPVQ